MIYIYKRQALDCIEYISTVSAEIVVQVFQVK